MGYLSSFIRSLRAAPTPGDAAGPVKAVLVSNFTTCLDLLERILANLGIAYERLDGSTAIKQRIKKVDTFNDPEFDGFFLLSSKAGGVGLNLIGGSRLVLVDPSWNPAEDAQALRRVWRDGQKGEVFVYRLVMSGTIEEKIVQRQDQKGDLLDNVMDQNSLGSATPGRGGEKPSMTSFTRSDGKTDWSELKRVFELEVRRRKID